MDSTYHYYAFISYATTDSKWAKWLQHQLSYYHIPSAVKKSKIDVPQRLRPIFIYEYDLAGNQLHKAIEKELTASKYLIVICSKTSAKSEYVNNEVQTFIDQGRQEYIIPFIIDGKANDSKNPENECFPPALLNLLQSNDKINELRGANIATNGKYQALVDVISTMLGVRRDVLWNRYKIRQMKQRLFMVALAIIVMLCGLFYWDYTRSTYEYYVDYVDQWGVPVGILKLDKKQTECRSEMYRFEKRRIPIGEPNAYTWRLTQVSFVNSSGMVIPISGIEYNGRYPIQKLSYSSENGILIKKTLCDEKGKKQVVQKLSRRGGVEACIVDFESAVAGNGIEFSKNISSIQSEGFNRKPQITRYVYERNENGNITKVTFHANNGYNLKNQSSLEEFSV